jgi:hypothetical protein
MCGRTYTRRRRAHDLRRAAERAEAERAGRVGQALQGPAPSG